MSQQYQVCEIEEPVSTFSVSAVPENWILQLKDGSYVCIWPKEKAGLKIRRRVPPESDGGKWFRYKCRILLDGEKFPTYQKAREAEIIAQNFSSFLDVSAVAQRKFREREGGTLSFDVSDADDGNGELINEGDKTFSVEEEKILKGNVLRRQIIFDVTDIPETEENLSEFGGSDTRSISSSGYTAQFNPNGGTFMASTLIDEIEDARKENVTIDTIMSAIVAIEAKCSLFAETIQKDFTELKELVKTLKVKDAQKGIGFALIPNVCPLDLDTVGQANAVDNLRSLNDRTFIIPEIFDTTEASQRKENDEDTQKCHPVEILNIEDLGTCAQIVPMTKLMADKLESAAEQQVAQVMRVTPKKTVVLPLKSSKAFKENEDLLDDTVFEDALIKHLTPFEDEEESAYMNRSVLMLFEQKFFLDFVTFKNEKNRVNIKNSTLLSCWKDSFKQRFELGNDDKKFLSHFRRMKSAKRAAQKKKP